MDSLIQIPVSVGELIDKLSILELKLNHLEGVAFEHVRQEHQLLEAVLADAPLVVPTDLQQQLQAVNTQLWEAEDGIRAKERSQDFGASFVELARSIYRLNDRRSAIKRAINLACGSPLIEEKLYALPQRQGEIRPTSPPSSSGQPPSPPPAAR
ncbi:DUF6165 family protein [Cyanobium sp. LEGE 06113]|uniref:DUF6165 family protein n=1 Tax=Cyanobium sp. LEGE 06113 TaxID=1297573 RepID=UPI001D137012|nr:DUF6165 family protein [Cyanobium sp. LEGE 06113]